MYKIKYLTLFLPLLFMSFLSCREQTADEQSRISNSGNHTEAFEIPGELTWDVIYNFSSIVEIPALFKDRGIPFHNGFIHGPFDTGRFDDNLKRALMLGVLGCNLGYIHIYGQTSELPGYITMLNNISDSIFSNQISDFLKFEILLAGDTDPREFLSSFMQIYSNIDHQLMEENRRYLSTLIVYGLWIEGLYMLTQLAYLQPDDHLTERIGAQKLILNDLLMLLIRKKGAYPWLDNVIDNLELLKEQFDKVEIVYEIEEPQAIEREGLLVVVQRQRSIVNIAGEQIENITRRTEEVRNLLIL